MLEELFSTAADQHPLATHLDRLPGRRLIDDRHLRLPRPARDGKPDQQGDGNWIYEQAPHQHLRAPKDQQVLPKQPPHPCPRSRRNVRKTPSKSSSPSALPATSSPGAPSNKSSPSANTIARVAYRRTSPR